MKSSLYKKYETDSVKETNGIVIEFDENEDKTIPSFLLSRLSEGNKAYMKELQRLVTQKKQDLKQRDLKSDDNQECVKSAFASEIIKGWSNIYDADGNILPYTSKNAIKLLSDLPDLYSELVVKSNDVELFRKDVLEESAKN